MFSKSKSKADKVKKNPESKSRDSNLAQLGLFEVPDMSGMSMDLDNEDECDDDLEAELLALTQGKVITQKRLPRRQERNVVPKFDDIPDDGDDEDISVSDEDDPELLAELASFAADDNVIESVPVITTPAPMKAGPNLVLVLSERTKLYQEALTNANSVGDTSRARRFKRGLKTLEEMSRSVTHGKVINEEDIPPIISARSAQPSPVNMVTDGNNETEVVPPVHKRKAPPVPASLPEPPSAIQLPRVPPQSDTSQVSKPSEDLSSKDTLLIEERLQEYKKHALKAKKDGDIEKAMTLLRTAKQLEPLLLASKQNQVVDMTSLPPSLSSTQSPTMTIPPPVKLHGNEPGPADPPAPSVEHSANQSNASEPPTPKNTLEALEQRYEKYNEQMLKAKNDGNSRKVRMNQRIIKQYQDAITQVKAGRLVDFDELPTPPGYAPIPLANETASIPQKEDSTAHPNRATEPVSKPMVQPRSPNAPSSNSQEKGNAPSKPGTNVRKNPQSRVERQLSVLKVRQQHFKTSALEAKKRGEIEQAKEYLRNCKGIDQLIAATESGLPVDMNTVPVPPQEAIANFNTTSDFDVITKEDCDINPTSMADSALTYTKLENDIVEQIKECAQTRQHFKALGDVASANRFEQLILHSKKDLDAVRAGFKRGDTPPKFHYETRSFTMVQCNTDLNDSDLELTIVRGINYNVQNSTEVDTYIKIEFPYPSENPPQDKTDVVKNTNCPEYNHKITFSIDRKSRSAVRIFKRQSIKCQIINRGGWFHRDNPLGMVKIPLIPLENKCTLHESYDLIDDRKKMIGGKLEVKVRVRNPILSKQLEKVTQKWLVIDGF